jgi:hypothetical protein
LGNVWDFVYVDLDKVDVGEFLGESVFILSVSAGGNGGKRRELT